MAISLQSRGSFPFSVFSDTISLTGSRPAQPAPREAQASLARRERPVLTQPSLGRPVPQVSPATLVHKELPAQRVRPVTRALRAPQVPLALPDLQVPREPE